MSNRLSTRWVVVIWVLALTMLATPTAAQTPTPLSFPLGEPGPYAVGMQMVKFTDTNRSEREMNNYVWYPAILPENTNKLQKEVARKLGWANAAPDLKAGPAPLILVSHGLYEEPTNYASLILLLVSHGFVVVGVDHPPDVSPLAFVNRPMDILFILDQLASINQSEFTGLIDTNHVGVMGDSLGGYTTLALTGARIDPAAASARTAKPLTTSGFSDIDPRLFWSDWNWDTITAYRAGLSQLKKDDLWPSLTDKRILAAAMESPCFIPMFGEQGLAAATVPTLIVGGVVDSICPYEQDTAAAFEQLGSPDRYMLSITRGGHVPTLNSFSLPIAFTAQLYMAFFGKYLKGQNDNDQYLTAEYIAGAEGQIKLGLVWGSHTGQ